MSPPDPTDPSDDDDGRTVIRPPARRAASAPLGHTLPLGTTLHDYEITGLIGEGGFGIVYLGWDHSLQRKVAIKEYMPASMASRVAGSSAIVVKSERHLDTFKAGLKSFVNEARLLARFDHPSLVKVYRYWEENGTAYMAMPFYEGPTLKDALTDLKRPPSEAELRAWLRPLLDALSVMHHAQCFHRDIAPDNILLTSTGPLLLDFGAARRVIGDMTHALTVVLKPGYAPIEQYGDVASMTQGAWTDIYALACVVYYAITGRTPMSSVERLMDDRLEPLAAEAKGRYGDAFLRAIDAALAVRPVDRPQNEAQFRALLDVDQAGPFPPPTSGYGDLHHEAFAQTEDRPYRTVPGTLMPVLATQRIERPPAPPAPEPVAKTELLTEWHPRAEPAPTAPAMPAVPTTATASHTPAWAPPVVPVTAPTALAPEHQPAAATRPAATSAQRAPAVARGKAIALSAIALLVVAALGGVLYRVLPSALGTLGGADDAASAASTTSTASPASSAASASAAVPTVGPIASAPPAIAPVAVPAATASAAVATALPASAGAQPASAAAVVRATVGMPVPAASAAAVVVAPSVEPRRRSPVVETPSTAARREPAARVDPPAETRPTTAPRGGYGSRCSDILQKASLEPLTAEEAAYLKRECR